MKLRGTCRGSCPAWLSPILHPDVEPSCAARGLARHLRHPPGDDANRLCNVDNLRDIQCSRHGRLDPFIPAPGAIAYYLTRAQNACGLGSAGKASDGTLRSAADCQPPPTPQGVRRPLNLNRSRA